jgi:hypothetical protein|tara:strand:- start:42 stop:437 length:396 start_codon:yes stop_codon:yes gene_type:complete
MSKAKRPNFSFPELDSRGRGTILRTSEEVAAEVRALEQQEKEEEFAASDRERIKVTYRFSPEAIDAVEDIRRLLRRNHGLRKVNREDIAQSAVIQALQDLEHAGAESFLAKHFTYREKYGEPAWREARGVN